jgi:di/tricarboxylate transporter
MFVLSAGLVRTGGVDLLGRWVARVGGGSEFRLLAISFAIVIPLSAFLNNTPVVVVMVPLVIGLSRTTGVRASRFLMPISFASQLGGTLTLIGTSTNLLVAGLVIDLGLERIRLFDITPPALVLTLLGVTYLLTLGRRLTPDRKASGDLLERYELGEYFTILELEEGSPLAGRDPAGEGVSFTATITTGMTLRPGTTDFVPATDRLAFAGRISTTVLIGRLTRTPLPGGAAAARTADLALPREIESADAGVSCEEWRRARGL